MYIVELFLKLIEDFKFKKGIFQKKEIKSPEEVEKCDHIFVPVDSTGRILACSKCGEIYKLEKGEVNPFGKGK